MSAEKLVQLARVEGTGQRRSKVVLTVESAVLPLARSET